MVVVINQTWWHVEDIYFPSKARKIRQIMGLFTNESLIKIQLFNPEFVGLKIIARNSGNREIAFLENDEENPQSNAVSIILNLDPLDSFPEVPRELETEILKNEEAPKELEKNVLKKNIKNKKLRHVKIEIQYILTDPDIKDLLINKWDKIKKILVDKKISIVEMQGKIQPEIYVTLPIEWRMGGNTFWSKFITGIDKEGYSIGMKCITPQREFDIFFNKPFILMDGGKRKYHYLINDDSYAEIKDIKDESDINFNLVYESRLCNEVVVISLFPILLFIIMLVAILFCISFSSYNIVQNILSNFNPNFCMAYIVFMVSFSIFEYNLIKEGFNIPHKYWHTIILVSSIIVITSILILDLIYSNTATPRENVINIFNSFFFT